MFALGIFQALGITLLISFYNVYLRIAVQEWHVQPVVFTCVCLMVSAFILSLSAGPGKLVKETLKSPATWLYSFVLIGAYVVDVYVMRYVSATEASFFSRMTIPLSLLIAWVLFKRKPKRSDMYGLSIIILGLAWLIYLQPLTALGIILFVVILSALFQTIQFVIAETHSEAVAASKNGTIRDKARVVGFVTFISSAVFLVLSLTLSFLRQSFDLAVLSYIDFLPEPSGFIHFNTVMAACFYGVFILPFIRYFKWAASYNLKAENILVFMAFIPVLTYAIESGAALVMDLPSNAYVFDGERGRHLLLIALMMTCGAGLTAFLKVKEQFVNIPKGESLWSFLTKQMTPSERSLTIQHAANAMDDYEVVCAAIEYCEDDLEKASEILGVPKAAVEVIRNGRGRDAFVAQVSQDVSRRFRQNVALSDALTSLGNRTSFMAALKAATASKSVFTVFYMDLNKFKPVNDTCGHEAGDFILKGVAERLINTFPKSATIARLGGDEFVTLVKCDKEKAADYISKISEEISKPFKFGKQFIQIGISTGIASYPEDATKAADLLKIADEGMYAEKS